MGIDNIIPFKAVDTDSSGKLDKAEVENARRMGCIWARVEQNEEQYDQAQDNFVKMVENGDDKEIVNYADNLIDEIIKDETKDLKIGSKLKVTQYAHDLLIDFYSKNKKEAKPWMSMKKARQQTEKEFNKNYEIMNKEEESRRYKMFFDILKHVNNILPKEKRATEEELMEKLPADISELPDFIWHKLNNQNMTKKESVKSYNNYLFNK